MGTSTQTWKSFERRVAKDHNTERESKKHLGESPAPDVVGQVEFKGKQILSIECKLRGSVPKTIQKIITQAEKEASNGHLPVGLLKEKYKGDDSSFVIMRYKRFKELYEVQG